MVGNMGPTLRAARIQQGLSLRSVAADIGVSASLLSQVETGKTQPSVSTFYALVNRLGISVDELFGVQPPSEAPARPQARSATTKRASRPVKAATMPQAAPVIQRAAEHPMLEMESGVTWELLTIGDRAVVDSLLVTYQPGASSSVGELMMQHHGVEYAYLLEGELTLRLEFETHLLHPGDSLCFDSTRPHQYVNNGEVQARGLWFVVGRRGLEVTRHAAALLAEAGFGDAVG